MEKERQIYIEGRELPTDKTKYKNIAKNLFNHPNKIEVHHIDQSKVNIYVRQDEKDINLEIGKAQSNYMSYLIDILEGESRVYSVDEWENET